MCKWEKVKLGDVVDFHNHKRVPLSSLQREKRKGQYPYYGASGIIDYLDDYIFDGKYLLISEDGENLRSRKTEIAFFAKSKFWVNNHAHIVTARENLDIDFLYYYIKILNISPYITGAVQPKLNKASLENIELPLPPLKEQKRIAAILSALDDKIEVNNQINKNLEEQAQAIFKSWFVDFDPFGGVMPSDWKESTLGDVCEISSSKRIFAKEYQEDGVPFYRGKEIIEKSKNIYISTTLYISEQRFNEIKEKYGVPLVGDILITAVGTLGALFYVGNENFYFKDGNIIWLKNFKELNSIFIYFLMKNTQFKNFIKSITIGSTQQALTIESLKKFPFFVPKNEDSKEIISLLHSIHSKVECNNSYNAHIKQIRDTLLPKLMNGEINA